jgi:GntR family transcriptional regulator
VIDPDLPVPLWEQLATILRDKIKSGELSGRVPSIRTLSQEYEVSTRTAERALNALRDEGLLVALHGKGYYVAR